MQVICLLTPRARPLCGHAHCNYQLGGQKMVAVSIKRINCVCGSQFEESLKREKLSKNENSRLVGLDKWHLSKYIFTCLLDRVGKEIFRSRRKNFVCSPHIVKSGNCRKLQIFIDASWQAPVAALEGSLAEHYVYNPPKAPPAPPTGYGKSQKNFPNHCFRSFSDVVTKPEQKSPREFQLGKIKDPEIRKYHQHKHRQIIEGKAKRGVH